MKRASHPSHRHSNVHVSPVQIPVGPVVLAGDVILPTASHSIVLFVHGSGSSRHSPRNCFVAQKLNDAGVGTLLFDLLTAREEDDDARDGHLRFDIPLLAGRLEKATAWISSQGPTQHHRIGYFGASTGGGAALVAAANLGEKIGAVVSRGGRPDLAGESLARVVSPTLLIVGERDNTVLRLNEKAHARLRCEAKLVVVRGASHLFEEPGALPHVATVAAEWFQDQLRPH